MRYNFAAFVIELAFAPLGFSACTCACIALHFVRPFGLFFGGVRILVPTFWTLTEHSSLVRKSADRLCSTFNVRYVSSIEQQLDDLQVQFLLVGMWILE